MDRFLQPALRVKTLFTHVKDVKRSMDDDPTASPSSCTTRNLDLRSLLQRHHLGGLCWRTGVLLKKVSGSNEDQLQALPDSEPLKKNARM